MLRIGSIVLSVDDLQRQAGFWAAALDYDHVSWLRLLLFDYCGGVGCAAVATTRSPCAELLPGLRSPTIDGADKFMVEFKKTLENLTGEIG